MSEYRLQRIAEAYRNEISSLLATELTDPVFEGVYITMVKLTHDMGLADVYFGLTEGQEFVEEVKRAFEGKKKFIRHALARSVRVKYVPDLRFFYDNSEELQEKIDGLLKDIDHDENKNP